MRTLDCACQPLATTIIMTYCISERLDGAVANGNPTTMLSLAADKRIAATAFGVGFGIRVGHGRDPAAKAAAPPAQAVAADARRKRRALSEAQAAIAARVGDFIAQEDWAGLLGLEREALQVAAALRRSSPADAGTIYGYLGHAHVSTMKIPVAIYADHGKCCFPGVSGPLGPDTGAVSSRTTHTLRPFRWRAGMVR